MTETEKLEDRRSKVRIYITYWATGFLFLFGPFFIGFLYFQDKHAEAINLFQTILPVSAAIVSFWFGARRGHK